MPVYVKKNQGENNDHLIQRFKKMVRGARYIMELKKHRRFEKPNTKIKQRGAAIMREHYRAKRRKEELAS
ncbi:30S ribosomal protein S21 [Candidatus Gracilibacteria bacterium CG17_big_fil_post_rev_8_21_14_2_50_48_13]|nr:MAG: 30S ribosomal protein S21 [Candidatus Gracilibacteria bacterium CG17_big_fil_post_rev_8_21_14_2_50_48_13]